MTIVCALVALAWGLVASTYFRVLAFKHGYSSSVAFAILASIALTVSFVPWSALALSVLRATQGGESSALLAGFAWFVCELAKHVPLMTVVVSSFVFTVSETEIAYQSSAGASLWELTKYTAFLPFRRALLGCFVFGVILIWNESAVASVFQNQINSFTEIAQVAVSGRGASFRTTSSLSVLSVLLASVIVGLWARGTHLRSGGGDHVA
jgi:hypothetical protein